MAEVALIPDTASRLVQCPACGVIRFDPLPTTEILNRFYSAAYYDFRRWPGEAGGAWFARKLRKISTTGRFLDVGCATGFFLNGIRQSTDWEVHGVEFSPDAAAYARDELGLDVRQGDLRDAGYPDGHFDYVHMNNVLEHVLDPVDLLAECRRVLKPGGHFFLAVPNGINDSRNLIEFHRTEGIPARSPSGHIFFFPARTLRWLLDSHGFTVLSKKTGSIKRGLRNAGILKRKKNWKADHQLRADSQGNAGQGVIVAKEKRKPDWYYRYRNFSAEMGNWPGLHDFGLDFLFECRKGE
ncbi:MAG: class I SAM-dependent methyltransferase [Candidatus Krumholzibacteriota bacterium]